MKSVVNESTRADGVGIFPHLCRSTASGAVWLRVQPNAAVCVSDGVCWRVGDTSTSTDWRHAEPLRGSVTLSNE